MKSVFFFSMTHGWYDVLIGSVPLIVLVILPSGVALTQGQFCPPDDIWYVWGHFDHHD